MMACRATRAATTTTHRAQPHRGGEADLDVVHHDKLLLFRLTGAATHASPAALCGPKNKQQFVTTTQKLSRESAVDAIVTSNEF